MGDSPDNGRKQRRVAVATRVRLKIDGPMGMVRYFTKNLSEGGLFIQTPKPLGKDQQIALQFHNAQGQVLFEALCVVMWARPHQAGSNEVPGMGVRFLKLTESGKTFVQKVLAKNREEPPAPREELFQPSTEPKGPPTPGVEEAFSQNTPAQPTPAPAFVGEAISFDDEDDFEFAEQTPPSGTPVPQEQTLEQHVEKTPPRGTRVMVSRPLPSMPTQTFPDTDLVLGIDLGTTYSCAAVVRNGKPEVTLSDAGHRTVPSVVHIGANIVVGWGAHDKATTDPKRTIFGSKRLLARQYTSQAVTDAQMYFDYEVVAGPNGEAVVQVENSVYPFDWVAMRILYELTLWARQHTQSHITKAVVAVPAYYNGRQRRAVIEAAQTAGLEVLQIVNEPTAAAIAYGVDRSVTQLAMIYDLGGGTFDASLLLIQGNVFQVLATGGDPYLGGVDFDHRLVDWALVEFEKETGINLSGDTVAMLRVREAVEVAKRQLSESAAAEIRLPFIARKDGGGVDMNLKLTREEFDMLIGELVDRTIHVCVEMLSKVGRRPEDVDLTLLVGGQTRTPLVQSKVHAFTGQPPRKTLHPDEAVALGAALLGESLREVERVTLLDVTSLPIGVAMPDGQFREVVPANSRLPLDQTVTLRSFQDQQSEMSVDVFQGTEAKASANEYLGTVRLAGLPALPAGQLFVQFTFTMDAQGFLTVTAIDTVQGQLHTVELETRDTPDSLRGLEIPEDLAPSPDEAQAERRRRVAEAIAKYTTP